MVNGEWRMVKYTLAHAESESRILLQHNAR